MPDEDDMGKLVRPSMRDVTAMIDVRMIEVMLIWQKN